MINLVMLLHCHQPVGNFGHVFQQAHDECYRPILDIISNHPEIRLGMHLSGPLLEWLDEKEPATIGLFKKLVEEGQVEPVGGGFYEPLLANIPERDARGQLEMMSSCLEERFGRRPAGLWLTERVWDPSIPRTLNGTGLEYTVVDDTHFYYAGLSEGQIYGTYITEKEGHALTLFSTPMQMRYMIPFSPVEEVIEVLRAMMERGLGLAVYGDDGEKFGMWPGTYEWVIQKGWLEEFFSAIEENRDWLMTSSPGEYVRQNDPSGRIYLPQASYEEMTEWALPAARGRELSGLIASLKQEGRWDSWRPYVRGGIWDNFLVKYEETNRMHKKMLFLSQRTPEDSDARIDLWRGQCNCAYWHGVFGGLYLGHLRRAIYENLLAAQKKLMENHLESPVVKVLDYDKDGRDEIIAWTDELSIGVSPAKGGSLFEISYLPALCNMSDTLTRRLESYHFEDEPVFHGEREEGIPSIHEMEGGSGGDLEGALMIDRFARASFVDHFFEAVPGDEEYEKAGYEDAGDFATGDYFLEKAFLEKRNPSIRLSRSGRVSGREILLEKNLSLKKGALLDVAYSFINESDEPLSFMFGCESSLNLYSDRDEKRYYRLPDSGKTIKPGSRGRESAVGRVDLVNGPDGLVCSIVFSQPVTFLFYPIMTVSKTEKGFEHTYQGSSLLFCSSVDVGPCNRSHLGISMKFKTIPKTQAE